MQEQEKNMRRAGEGRRRRRRNGNRKAASERSIAIVAQDFARHHCSFLSEILAKHGVRVCVYPLLQDLLEVS